MLNTEIIDLGLIDYKNAFEIQKKCVDEVISGKPNKIFLCEHPTVLTLGKLSKQANILTPPEVLFKKNIKIYHIDRGGDVTLHSPGQLIIYPVLNLSDLKKDLKLYLFKLEKVVIDLLKHFDILANRFSGKTGVWVGEKKIASIGISVRKWVTYHGIGLNVNTDLNLFSLIKPCGLDVSMTSIKQIKKTEISIKEIKKQITKNFSEEFNLQIYGKQK